MSTQTGRCLCGKVTYQITAEPVFQANCHCTNCQKASGTAFSANIGIPTESFSVSGDSLTFYLDTGDSGQALKRFFCSQCGSPIYTAADIIPDIAIVKVGTLDDPHHYQAGLDIWCQSKMKWLDQPNHADQFEQGLT